MVFPALPVSPHHSPLINTLNDAILQAYLGSDHQFHLKYSF